MLNFEPVSNALSGIQRQQNQNRQFEMQDRQFGLEEQRFGLAQNADRRADEDQGFQRTQRLAQKFGAIGQVIADDPNPQTAQANWARTLQSVPQLGEKIREYGIDPNDYRSASRFLMAEAGKYRTRADLEREQLQTQVLRRQANAPVDDGSRLMQTPDGKVIRVPRQGAAEEVYSGGPRTPAPPAGYTFDPNNPGALRPIPGGPADPANKQLTEGQTKDAFFGERMLRAERILDEVTPIDETGRFTKYNPTTLRQALAPDDGRFANLVNSKEWQQYMQASKESLAAILRKDTGAAVTKTEFDMYFPMYFPQPGDGPEVVKQKRDARRRMGQGVAGASGPAFGRMFPESTPTQQQAPASQPAPSPYSGMTNEQLMEMLR
jgi:hypothetical protein